MKLTAQELQDDGFKQYGNWWLKEHTSINLFSKTIKRTGRHSFALELDALPPLTIINAFSEIMTKITGD